jgi:hypothetical protein
VSLQLPQLTVVLSSIRVDSEEGSFAFAQSGDVGAERIAARSTLSGPASVDICPALAREPISSSDANNRTADLIFMRVSFKGRFTDKLQRSPLEPLASFYSH